MLIWADGFDHYGADETKMTTRPYVAVTGSLQTDTVRTGSHSMGFGSNQFIRWFNPFFDDGESEIPRVGVGLALWLPALPSVGGTICPVQYRNDAGDPHCTYIVRTDGRIELRQGGSAGTVLLTTAVPVISAGRWHHIEAFIAIDSFFGQAELRVDRVTVIDGQGLNLQAGEDLGIEEIWVGQFTSGAAIAMRVDDFFVWDTSYEEHPTNNDFLGDMRAVTLFPSGDTTTADWSVVGSARGFGAIDDGRTGAADDDTTYLGGPTGTGHLSEFDFDDLLDGASLIAGLVPVTRMKEVSGNAEVRVGLVSGTAVTAPDPHALTTSYANYHDVSEIDPQTGAPWSATAVNDARLSLEKTAGASTTARCTLAAIVALCHVTPSATQWAECWKVTRVDGAVLGFTGHDQEIDFAGTTYTPCGSLSASAVELSAVMGGLGNMELAGVIVSELIEEADLFGGLYDGATVEVWIVPWESVLAETPRRIAAGKIGTVTQGDVSFTAEVLTPGARLQQQPLLSVYAPACRFEFGDARCGFDVDGAAETGTVTSVATVFAARRHSRRQFTDSSRAEDGGHFNLGVLTWITGANAGQRSEVKDFGDATFKLYEPTVHPIEVGDTYEVTPGCGKTTFDHLRFFPDDLSGFGGFPDVPGRDALVESPDSHA